MAISITSNYCIIFYKTIQDNTGPYSTAQNHTGPCCKTMQGHTGPCRSIQVHTGLYESIQDYTVSNLALLMRRGVNQPEIKNAAKRSRQHAGKRYREYAQRRVCFVNEQVP